MLVLVLAPGLELVLGLVREKSIEWHAPLNANHLHDHPREPIIGHQNEDTHEPDESEQV